jgi:spore coat protein H
MKLNLKYISILSFFLLNSRYSECQPDNSEPDWTDRGRKIENHVSFNTSRKGYGNIISTSGRKVTINATGLVINGDSLEPVNIKTRGKSTLLMRRKSYSIRLRTEAKFGHGGKKLLCKKFIMPGLSMDRNYCNNRLAFGLMESAGLFNLFYSFCELRINKHSEGVYMVIERPEEWALKKIKSPILIRRGFENSIDKIETGKKTGKEEISQYRKKFLQIYRSLAKYEGEELFRTLSDLIDLNIYMKWMAFNFFVRNGDYTDEVFFYVDPDSERFSIIPWDYDDLFSRFPHEGIVENRMLRADKLYFSTEDLLDQRIVTDPYLYRIYLVQFRELMNQLSADVIKRVFEDTYAELYPYYSDNEIIANSRYDLHGETNLNILESNMLALYQQLIVSRVIFLQKANNELSAQ